MMRVREAVGDALRDIRVVAMDEPMTMDQLAHGARTLDRMLRDWQNYGYCVWTKATQDVTLTSASSYVLPTRAVQVLDVLYVQSGTETPMERMSREEYDRLPNKTSAGRPTVWHEIRTPTATTIAVWPVQASPSGQALRIVYNREIADQTSATATLDCPPEWRRAVVKSLAVELAPAYVNADVSLVRSQAGEALSFAMGADREESVFFS